MRTPQRLPSAVSSHDHRDTQICTKSIFYVSFEKSAIYTARSHARTLLSAVAAELVERFRRQRPLRAGSLIVTIFGDSIMPRGGAIALGSLIPPRRPLRAQ